jgi:hypothetical protein
MRLPILRFDDAPVSNTSMPVGTLLIRGDGERVEPPWSE